MNFDPLLNAPVYIQLHAICALISLAIGPIALYRKNRDRTHKRVGYVWMTTMATTAISSFWIREINADGSLSPVHLFAILALGTLIYALWAIWRRDINAHRHALRNLYFGTVAAVAMNFIPDRTLPNVFFDGGSWTTFVSAAVIIALVIASVTIITRNRA